MRPSWKVLAALAFLAVSFAVPARAGVPTTIFVDEFGYVT